MFPTAASKTVVAVFLRDRERAKELAGRFDAQKFESHALQTSDELSEFLASRRTDVVIIENDFKSFFTGLEILERVFRDLLHPPDDLVGGCAS